MVLTLEIFGISRFLERMRLSKTSTVFFIVVVAVAVIVVVVVPLDSTRLPLALCARVSLYFGRFLLLGCFTAYISFVGGVCRFVCFSIYTFSCSMA